MKKHNTVKEVSRGLERSPAETDGGDRSGDPAVQLGRVHFQRPGHFRGRLSALQPPNRGHFELL
jgi:hypothetical protein